jgi:hypothetical protein
MDFITPLALSQFEIIRNRRGLWASPRRSPLTQRGEGAVAAFWEEGWVGALKRTARTGVNASKNKGIAR